jgi:hypothetical protein
MNLTPISVTACACSEEETRALALWSAAFLPFCRAWAARRGLRPPAEVVEALQRLRFQDVPSSGAALEPLVKASPYAAQEVSHTAGDAPLEKLAAALARDLWRYQVGAAALDAPESMPAPRDVSKFEQVLAAWQFARVVIVASAPLIVCLDSLPRATLFLPRWLIAADPQQMFAPNSSFHRLRPASLAWLLLDAVALLSAHEFRSNDVTPLVPARS